MHTRTVMLVGSLIGALVGAFACDAAREAARKAPNPTVMVLEARKACTLYALGNTPRTPELDEMCDALLVGCGAGGAAQ